MEKLIERISKIEEEDFLDRHCIKTWKNLEFDFDETEKYDFVCFDKYLCSYKNRIMYMTTFASQKDTNRTRIKAFKTLKGAKRNAIVHILSSNSKGR